MSETRYVDNEREDLEEDDYSETEEEIEELVEVEYDEDEEEEEGEGEEQEQDKSHENNDEFSRLLSLPPHGSEVFIGGLYRDVREEDLRDLCEPIGEIVEVRIVKDKNTGESKGFAFVSFRTKDLAQKAIEELHNKEFNGRTIRCSLSDSKNKLFIGNIPKNWTEDELRKVLDNVGPGIENIELVKDPTNSSRNRGFAFILYYNNACADYSRLKMQDSSFKLDENTPNVSWVDSRSSSENSAAASQVKALYVKNIPENTSTETLKEMFQRHGEVINIVMPPGKTGKRDFGFVYYAERSSALKAIKDTEKYEINGQTLDVVLAKPQTEKRQQSHGSVAANANTSSSLPFAATNPYGSDLGLLNQPMIYGGGAMPIGMQMVPMLLPDGRVGYVLQQPSMPMMVQPPRPTTRRVVDRSNGSTGGSGPGSRRYRPY